MKLLHRILLAPAAAVLSMAALGAVCFSAMSRQDAAVGVLHDVRVRNLQAANDAKSAVLDVHSRVYRLFTWAANLDEAKLEKEGKALVADLARVADAFAAWSGRAVLQEGERKLVRQVGDQITKYHKDVGQALDLASSDLNMGLSAMQTADESFAKLSTSTAELVRLGEALSKQAREDAGAAYRSATAMATMALVAAVIVAGLLGLAIARSITRRMRAATDAASRITAGDLSGDVSDNGSDEVGELNRAMREMQANLRAMIGEIAASSNRLHGAAGEISNAANGMSRSADEQGASISEAAAAVEEITTSIAQVSESASAARGVAEETVVVARTGGTLANSAITEMDRVAEAVDATHTVIKELHESSQKIGGIANVISEIAGQTNLLALNAAIEAARAGEQGRGFAVVADEVRKLADKTGQATHEIMVTIEAIQTKSDQASTRMGLAAGQVASGARLVQDLHSPLVALQESAARALASLTELTEATIEQRNASSLIAQNVEVISRRGEDNSLAAGRSSALAVTLGSMAGELQSAIGRFRA